MCDESAKSNDWLRRPRAEVLEVASGANSKRGRKFAAFTISSGSSRTRLGDGDLTEDLRRLRPMFQRFIAWLVTRTSGSEPCDHCGGTSTPSASTPCRCLRFPVGTVRSRAEHRRMATTYSNLCNTDSNQSTSDVQPTPRKLLKVTVHPLHLSGPKALSAAGRLPVIMSSARSLPVTGPSAMPHIP
jgi:hypothetical protein